MGAFIFRWVYKIMPTNASTMPMMLYALKSPPKMRKLSPHTAAGSDAK